MTIIIEVKTKSHNGLPLWELLKAMTEYGMDQIESINYERHEKGLIVYSVALHERTV